MMETRIFLKAALSCKNRQSYRENPEGERDADGIWRPSAAEKRDCCDRERDSGPFHLLTHCRTIGHICRKYDVSAYHLALFICLLQDKSERDIELIYEPLLAAMQMIERSLNREIENVVFYRIADELIREKVGEGIRCQNP